MELRPCGQCRRHVDIDASRCPFCQAVLAVSTPRAVVVGRISRAAVFASATLAGACWTGSSTTKPTTPVETAKAADSSSAIAAGEIRGVVRSALSGETLAGLRVLLVHDATGAQQQGLTDDKGEYVFSGLVPGGYAVRYQPADPRHPSTEIHVVLADGAGLRADLAVRVPAADRAPHHLPAPYGAPPARRRIV